MAFDQDVLELVDRLGIDDRRRLPDLQPLIALRGRHQRLRTDAGKVRLEHLADVRGRGLCRPQLRLVDGIGPALNDRGILLDVLLGRHERGVVGEADGLADRSQKVRLAVELELRGVRLDEDGVLVLAREPGAHARLRRDVVHELHVLLRVDAVLAQRRLEEKDRRAAGAEAEDLLALEHVPVELVDLVAPDQHEAVGRGEAAEDAWLGRRVAVHHVDGRFRAHQSDVGRVGEQRRHGLVAAVRGRERLLDADLLEVALGNRDIGRGVHDRAHNLVVAHLHRRLLLSQRA